MHKKPEVILFFLLFLIIFQFFFTTKTYSQDSWWKNKRYSSEAKRLKFAECKKVFVDIADGISYSNVYMIVPYFGSEVYLNFVENEKGYYSPDQAQFIMDNFFTNYPASSFKWKVSNATENFAFALGKHKYKKNGYSNKFDVSVSLKYFNNKWLIDQVIVN
jgi:uncharacterized protein DUF4783